MSVGEVSGPLCILSLLPAWKPCSLKKERAGEGPSIPFCVCPHLPLWDFSPASSLLCLGLLSALEVSLTSRDDQRLSPFFNFDDLFPFLIFIIF